MPVLKSAVNPRAEEFRRNAASLAAVVDDLRAKVAAIREGGGAEARRRHLARNKLLPRERIRTLLDSGSPFLELSQLAAYEVYDEKVPAAGETRRTSSVSAWRTRVPRGAAAASRARRSAGRALLRSLTSTSRWQPVTTTS